jgi:hypothetical protein
MMMNCSWVVSHRLLNVLYQHVALAVERVCSKTRNCSGAAVTKLRFDSCNEYDIFMFCKASMQTIEPNQTSVEWVLGSLSLDLI